ncbi:MAG: glucose-1-phosphate adenylyltransferase subunit GlgD [Clostridia bacterium]|nr:glucose-1-phosphate adenylyltransferase subunit GlgD [Clostridia bacterium]
MKNVMGIIHHIKDEAAFREITKYRCVAAIPFGGKYRLVDFPLSNMTNAGISNIGIITSLKMRSLIDHLGTGKEWGLDRKRDGLFILPAASGGNEKNRRRLDLEDIHVNLDYLENSQQEYVLLTGSNIVCNLDLAKVVAFHQEKNADVTVVCSEDYQFLPQDVARGVYLQKEKEGRISAVSPGKPHKKSVISMDMYLLKMSFLLQLLEECASLGKWDFVSEVLPVKLKKIKMYGYVHQGYLGLINSWQSLYKHQMELLNPKVWRELFWGKGLIHTKIKDGPPARYYETSEIKNVFATSGCLIEGSVKNSILFRKVKVGRGAVIRNSVLFPKVEIEENVVLDGVIIDKNVQIKKGMQLIGNNENPVIIEKNQKIGGGF